MPVGVGRIPAVRWIMSVSSLTAAVDRSQCLYCEQVDHNKHDDTNIKNNNANQSYTNNSISYNNNNILLVLILLLTIIYNYHHHHHTKNIIMVVHFFILYPTND